MKLNDFIRDWTRQYTAEMDSVKLFDIKWTQSWTFEQKAFFVRAFYHIRGHCNDFFWFVANHTEDVRVKNVILENTDEEYGKERRSHEQLFLKFAEEFGFDLRDELVNETTNLPFIKGFNKGHIEWLATHEAAYQFAAFSAYEKLDNPDYNCLYNLATSISKNKSSLLFFDVHRYVEHFEATSEVLQEIWNKDYTIVRDAFEFIGNHQLKMWRELGESVNSHQYLRTRDFDVIGV